MLDAFSIHNNIFSYVFCWTIILICYNLFFRGLLFRVLELSLSHLTHISFFLELDSHIISLGYSLVKANYIIFIHEVNLQVSIFGKPRIWFTLVMDGKKYTNKLNFEVVWDLWVYKSIGSNFPILGYGVNRGKQNQKSIKKQFSLASLPVPYFRVREIIKTEWRSNI